MSDIVAFLSARLEEDQAAIEAPESWTEGDEHRGLRRVEVDESFEWVVASTLSWRGSHIARHDPARVLREVKAKRAIVEWHAVRRTARDARDPEEQKTVDICWCGYDQPCATIRHLAAVYADHPDYKPEWMA